LCDLKMPTKNMLKLYCAIPELLGIELAPLKYGQEAALYAADTHVH